MLTARQFVWAWRRIPRMSVDRAVVLDGDTRRLLGLDNLEDLVEFLTRCPRGGAAFTSAQSPI